VRGRTIQDDGSGATLARDDIGFKAVAVGEIAAKDALVGIKPGFLHEIRGDGNAAFVVHIGSGDRCAVNLRLQNVYLHKRRAGVSARSDSGFASLVDLTMTPNYKVRVTRFNL
jgi:hypothetical protein